VPATAIDTDAVNERKTAGFMGPPGCVDDDIEKSRRRLTAHFTTLQANLTTLPGAHS
jgi:hypothetical protein